MKLYKGFNKNLQCRGFQYEIGKEFEELSADLCRRGFHACENPLDVFGYYSPNESRYCEVELDDVSKETSNDSKRVGTKIKIGAEIGIKGLIDAFIKFTFDKVDWKNAKESNTGDRSAATNTGDRSAATNTGDQSAATNTGYQSAATNTGDRSAATNTGDRSAATNTGYQSAATNTGDQSAATNTGDRSAATNTGYQSAATNTGDQSAATNTGYQSAATNTGYQSAATNTGDQSAATNTGDRSAATNTGDQSAATNTGDRSAATVEGVESVAMSVGIKGTAKGIKGCWLVLAEWECTDEWHRKDVKCILVDGEKIKEDTFYKLENGEFVEV
ncbi:DUF7666 domain-containing protein [Anaerovorax sp. IOR16]|uniref:DUF7666 domain-containing protein n=1 Tax=Anaerovorax sp. IOR16 TaxID=2773458 RepID=UPI001FD6FCFE|nr:hypothetical protein [Anaerovorax sp. IOR16]